MSSLKGLEGLSAKLTLLREREGLKPSLKCPKQNPNPKVAIVSQVQRPLPNLPSPPYSSQIKTNPSFGFVKPGHKCIPIRKGIVSRIRNGQSTNTNIPDMFSLKIDKVVEGKYKYRIDNDLCDLIAYDTNFNPDKPETKFKENKIRVYLGENLSKYAREKKFGKNDTIQIEEYGITYLDSTVSTTAPVHGPLLFVYKIKIENPE